MRSAQNGVSSATFCAKCAKCAKYGLHSLYVVLVLNAKCAKNTLRSFYWILVLNSLYVVLYYGDLDARCGAYALGTMDRPADIMTSPTGTDCTQNNVALFLRIPCAKRPFGLRI